MSFSVNVSKFSEQAIKDLKLARNGVLMKLFASIIKDTPVDSGRLRGNWVANEGFPLLTDVEILDPSGTTATHSMINVIQRAKPDGEIYFTNNMPYAAVVEYGQYNGPTDKVTAEGYSKKAPDGMVVKNVVRFKGLLSREVSKLRR